MTSVNGTLVAVPPPPGYVVDFNNPQRRLESQVYTVIVVENLLALAFLLQRLYTRVHLMKLFQVEDGKIGCGLRFRKSSLTYPRSCRRRMGFLHWYTSNPDRRVAAWCHRCTCVGNISR